MRFLPKHQTEEMVNLSGSTINRLEAMGRFPKRVKIGVSRVAWVEEELDEWIAERIRARDRRLSA